MAQHRKRRPRRRALRIVTAGALAAAAVGGGGLAYAWHQLDGNLRGVDIDGVLGEDRPQNRDDGSLDILLLGSDSRAGANAAYGRNVQAGARSDTTMVLHVDKDRRTAGVVSIPRDTLVDRPACTAPDGGTTPAAHEVMFNEAFHVGGPACTVKTVERMSGIRMDHYLEVDFSGFTELVDELGGVEVTTRQAIHDDHSHLHLEPGTHTLRGDQALGLVRTRHGVGDGSDLGRIQLQQAFVKALVRQVGDIGLFEDPARLYRLADTATRTLSTDADLASVGKLLDLAESLKDIEPDRMDMVTLPVGADPQDPDRVLPLEKDDALVWKALRQDRRIPEAATENSLGDRGDAAL